MKVQETVPLLFVSDISKSRDFYCDGLGFLITTKSGSPMVTYLGAGYQHGGAALMLQEACDDDPPAGTWGKGIILYFTCEDAEIVYHEITERGIEASRPAVAFYGMNQTFITDPDGYELCFENPTQEP